MFEGSDPLVSVPDPWFLAGLPAERALAILLLAMLFITMVLAHAP